MIARLALLASLAWPLGHAAYLPAPCASSTPSITTPGCVRSAIGVFGRTASAISVTMPAVSVVAAGLLPSVNVSVPGVLAGDFVAASFAATPPTTLSIGGAQAVSDGVVRVTPIATGALTLAAGPVGLNFAWMH